MDNQEAAGHEEREDCDCSWIRAGLGGEGFRRQICLFLFVRREFPAFCGRDTPLILQWLVGVVNDSLGGEGGSGAERATKFIGVLDIVSTNE